MVHRSDIPKDRKVAYAQFVCNYRTHKEEANWFRVIVSGDRVDYPGDVSTKTADLPTIKCLLNSVLSNLRARFMTTDVKNFYLNTPLDKPEYMRISMNMITAEVMEGYQGDTFV